MSRDDQHVMGGVGGVCGGDQVLTAKGGAAAAPISGRGGQNEGIADALSPKHTNSPLQTDPSLLKALLTRHFSLVGIPEIEAAFNKLDKNKDGKLSFDELNQMVSTFDVLFGLPFGPETSAVRSLMLEADTDGDGFLSFEEFTAAFVGCTPSDLQAPALPSALRARIRQSLLSQPAGVAEHFSRFDTDNDGVITISEFKNGLSAANIEFTEREAEMFFDTIDLDCSGSLSLDEFASEIVAPFRMPVRATPTTDEASVERPMKRARTERNADANSPATSVPNAAVVEEANAVTVDGSFKLPKPTVMEDVLDGVALTSASILRMPPATEKVVKGAQCESESTTNAVTSKLDEEVSTVIYNSLATPHLNGVTSKGEISVKAMSRLLAGVLRGSTNFEVTRRGYTNGWKHFVSSRAKQVAEALDKDKSGGISRDEFVTFTESNPALVSSLQHLKDMFDTVDADKSGTLSENELSELLSKEITGPSGSARSNAMLKCRARSLIKVAAWSKQSKKKGLEFVEFLDLLHGNPELLHCHEGLRAIFRQHDRNGDGKISQPELLEVLSLLPGWPEEHPPSSIEEIFKRVDTDGDGLISFEEFSEHCAAELSAPEHSPLPVTLSWMLASLREGILVRDWNALYKSHKKEYEETGTCVVCRAPLIGKCPGSLCQYGFDYCCGSCRSSHVHTSEWWLAKEHADKLSDDLC